jgi:hypothetical protein
MILKSILIILHIGYGTDAYIDFYIKLITNILNNNKYSFSTYITINDQLLYTKIQTKFTDAFLKYNIISTFKPIINIGADTLPFLDFLLENKNSYDYVIKLHTKTFSYWTYLLNSIFMDLDELINIFDKDNTIGIIGHARYNQPFYYGLSKLYKENLNKLLLMFNINESIDIDYLDILNKHTNINEFTKERSKLYLEYRPDLYYNNITSTKDTFTHFTNVRKTELNHAAYDINKETFLTFIAGTIFIMRGDILTLSKSYENVLNNLKNNVETIPYYSNFDHNGTVFRYTSALEYILQGMIYTFGYKTYGYVPKELLNNSLYLKHYNFDLIKVQNNINKPKILFISNELSKTGAPIMLKRIIELIKNDYIIYLLSYSGGDDVDSYTDLMPKENIFIIYENNRELGFNNFFELSNICKKLCDIIDPNVIYINTLVGVFGIYGSYNKKRKIILHIHEAYEEIINLYNANLIIGYDFLKYVNHLITVNYGLDEIFKNYVSNDILTRSVIFNEITLNNTFCSKDTFLKSKNLINLDLTKKIIGGIGTISSRKGFDIYIDLAKLYPNLIFIWASNNVYTEQLPLNLFIVNCNKDDIASFYNCIDVLLFTSRSEAFPLAFWECLLCKKYVFCSNKTIPLDENIFKNSGVELLNGYSNVKLFVSILDKINNNEIDLELFNNKINIKYIEELCTVGFTKIKQIVNDTHNILDLELEYPVEYKLYDNLHIYNKFLSYGLTKDLLLHKFNNFDNNLNHFMNHGYNEGRLIYKFPCLIKKRVLFILHDLDFHEDTKIGLDIANNLQTNFDIIIISFGNSTLINSYCFENKPIILGQKIFEYNIIKYLDVNLATYIIKELHPDIVYINCYVCHDFYDASCNLNIPTIYHNHEKDINYTTKLTNKLDIQQNITNIIGDIYESTNGVLRSKKIEQYFYDIQYGYITYDFNTFKNAIRNFIKKHKCV